MICAVDPCPGGLDAVVVGGDSGVTRSRARGLKLALEVQDGGWQGQREAARRRQLEEAIDGVSFLMPTAGQPAGDGDGRAEVTGAQQAAALFNSIADSVRCYVVKIRRSKLLFQPRAAELHPRYVWDKIVPLTDATDAPCSGRQSRVFFSRGSSGDNARTDWQVI